MACYSPLKAFRPLSKDDGGRLVFNPAKALNRHHPISIPCGQCVGCRLDRSREWAARCAHEAEMHSVNCFITLTYSDDHLPDDYSVSVRTFQLFMKRLRKSLNQRIRFFACGEYGDLNLRPHYHALIFNHAFDNDKILFKTTSQGNRLYTSPSLSEIWPYGHCIIGDLNYKTAAYTARYVMKKITGDRAEAHYRRTHPVTGKQVVVQPEFCVQSRRPGIGAAWFEKWKSDAFPSDFLIVDGRKHSVPSYYFKKLAEEEQSKFKRERKWKSHARKSDNTSERLRVREQVKISNISRLKREL